MRARPPRTPSWLRRLVTFHLVVAAWVLFRAPSLGAVAAIVRGLGASRPMLEPFPLGVALIIMVGAVSHAISGRFEPEQWWLHAPRFVQGTVLGLVIVLVGVFSAQSQRFIYFQF
jgi:hypothetical protein